MHKESLVETTGVSGRQYEPGLKIESSQVLAELCESNLSDQETIDKIIYNLFDRSWSGESTLKSLDAMKKQLWKNLTDQMHGYWSGSTAYSIMVTGGFLVDGKKGTNKQLTVRGMVFVNQHLSNQENQRLNGNKLIFIERNRQLVNEGRTLAQDIEQGVAVLEAAGDCYLGAMDANAEQPVVWPWDHSWWKPKTRQRNLERAGALYLAAADVAGATKCLDGEKRLQAKFEQCATALDELLGIA